MKAALSIVALVCASAFAVSAASIDGKWVFQAKAKPGKKGGAERTVTTTFNLKSNGNELTGTVMTDAGKRGRTADITAGTIDGDRFTFTSVQRTRKGETKIRWSGTVEGDQLKGSRAREGARKGQTFVAKRS